MAIIQAYPRRHQGFTLLEIMAAFVVFTLIFSISLHIITQSLTSVRRSEGYTQAVLWAQSHMDAIGVEQPLTLGADSGDFDDRYRWEQVIEPYHPEFSTENSDDTEVEPLEVIDLFHIRLTVYWDGDRRHVEFTTLTSLVKESVL